MKQALRRREFLHLTGIGGFLCFTRSSLFSGGGKHRASAPPLISPGCRRSKVKVARFFMGSSHGLWPKPGLDLEKEAAFYRQAFERMKADFADIDFFVDKLVTTPDQVSQFKDRLKEADGILAIHFNIGISEILKEILRAGKPTIVFAIPYSGHEWVSFGELRQQPLGAKMDCFLTSDLGQLAVAVRPFRAIHHLREAKILNLTTHSFAPFAEQAKSKFGTEVIPLALDRVVAAYQNTSDMAAREEADSWIKGATQVVEPSHEEILKSCKLALAFEKLLEEEEATVLTVDCYGTMWDKTIKLPAYPCLGFARLNNLGLGGICESDLRSAMIHVLFQGLVGRPGFISDPTVDESRGTIILAHCLGTPKMDGPGKPSAPYKIRTVMERREGVVPQVEMRVGEKVTQAIFVDLDTIRYFTGTIVSTPVGLEVDRGCRTKIEVKIDGDIVNLWKNWTGGLHRQTVYGDITKELFLFCRFMDIKIVNEAV